MYHVCFRCNIHTVILKWYFLFLSVDNFHVMVKFLHVLRRLGNLDAVSCVFKACETFCPLSVREAGYNYCKGLYFWSVPNVRFIHEQPDLTHHFLSLILHELSHVQMLMSHKDHDMILWLLMCVFCIILMLWHQIMYLLWFNIHMKVSFCCFQVRVWGERGSDSSEQGQRRLWMGRESRRTDGPDLSQPWQGCFWRRSSR